MGLFGTDISYSSNQQSTQTTDKTQNVAPGTAYGSVNALTESSNNTIYATDMGAISAGLQIASQSLATAGQATSAALNQSSALSKKASEIVETKAESDITKFFKPIVWGGGILVLGVVAVVYFIFRKKG